ncbi:MAG: DUF4292 domain-containing protein [Bacteroidia bacterium]|nr:DUF4292 domain-containing protein [Bacteroidia bacterium]
MRRKIINTCLIILLPVVFLLGCKTKKNTIKKTEITTQEIAIPNSPDLLFTEIKKTKNSAAAVYYKADVDYNDGKQEVSLELELQAQQDQYIWLNAKALGFVNVARILIKPDSIRIIDLINKTYISASYNYMRSFSEAPINFEQLQNLVLGNAIFDPSLPGTVLDTMNQMLTILINLGTTQQKSVYNKALKTQTVLLTEQGRNRQMTVTYGDFLLMGDNSFPQQFIINIQGEKKLDCKFRLNNFATELKRDAQFVVPKSYKVQVL